MADRRAEKDIKIHLEEIRLNQPWPPPIWERLTDKAMDKLNHKYDDHQQQHQQKHQQYFQRQQKSSISTKKSPTLEFDMRKSPKTSISLDENNELNFHHNANPNIGNDTLDIISCFSSDLSHGQYDSPTLTLTMMMKSSVITPLEFLFDDLLLDKESRRNHLSIDYEQPVKKSFVKRMADVPAIKTTTKKAVMCDLDETNSDLADSLSSSLCSRLSNVILNTKKDNLKCESTSLERLKSTVGPTEDRFVDATETSAAMLTANKSSKLGLQSSKWRWIMSRTFFRRFNSRKQHLLVSSSTSSSLAIFYLILYILGSAAMCLAARQEAVSNCTFPQRWEGSWFLSGYQQSIHIKGSQFSYRGRCIASDGNKYLIAGERGCHRCLVIYEKHKNVLQYKESECEGDSMYMDQSNPAAVPLRSVLKSDRGGAHPNLNAGHSRLSSSDQYIMRSNDDINDYYCKGRESLQNLCDQIPGDALLYSLFKENAEPVKCPLKGPFTFTYNRGHGECRSPVSNIESCTEDSRLLLSFQACPDVHGTESTLEELTCLATWKDGNSRYLVGLVSHHHAISNEERFRCFVYEKISPLSMSGLPSSMLKDAEYKLAQSGDATCNGLDSAEVGSRIMTLRKPAPAERCDFPQWVKGPRHWHALKENAGYTFHQSDGSMHITKANGNMETRALCEQINKQTSSEMMAVVHYTTGCQSGFMCMMFYRRDMHVTEIQRGEPASRLEDACAPDHFDINKQEFITLLASNTEQQMCPLEGLYTLKGAIGPPYITSRHKRNHNNKGHNQHGHHHHEQQQQGHKRHETLSFRTSEEFGHTSWQSHTRGIPIRSRRAALAIAGAIGKNEASTSSSSSSSTLTSGSEIAVPGNIARHLVPASLVGGEEIVEKGQSSGRDKISAVENFTPDLSGDSRITITTQQSDEMQRNRRDAPGCVVNYRNKRQLLIGCTEPNVIEVRPQCNEDGDEEYSCHGSWTENGTVYIVARHKATQHGVCISYRPLLEVVGGSSGSTTSSSFTLVIGDRCYRGQEKPPDHHLVANLTSFGKCGDTSSSNPIYNDWILGWEAIGIIISILLFTNR